MWTIDKIVQANEDAGHYFFSEDTMRFFRSRVLDEVYEGPGGVFFVTSEQFEDSAGHLWPRKYKVRQFNPENGHVWSVPTLCEMDELDAVELARKCAEIEDGNGS
jgi:hypothetical protein